MTDAGATPNDEDHRLGLLRTMVRIRRFEERCVELYSSEEIRGFLHLAIGEEAIPAGVIGNLRSDDAIVATYREHGHALARGVPARSIMAEMLGRQEGCSGGRGGSMHLFDADRRFYGGNAIVAAGLPVAVGLALADKLAGVDRVTACFFGEGAVAEGEFHESMNLAAVWDLPVLFCCENNLYAMGTALDRSESEVDLTLKAAAYEMPAWPVDAMDALAVARASADAVASIRHGGGPHFLELRTYRFRAHSMYDPERYRSKAEVDHWKERDPITTLADSLRSDGVLDDDGWAAIETAVADEVDDAVAFARAGTLEPVEHLARWVVSPKRADASGRPAPTGAPAVEGSVAPVRTTYREALRDAIREALAADDRVLLMGEDVGAYGGCFAVSLGLLEEFGPERVRDTPLSESAFVGAGIGAALGGRRPIVEIMTVNFSLLALDQLMNNAATYLHMSGGQLNVPLVVRMTTGAGRQLAAQHSHSLEGWYAHMPGLRVLAPGTIDDARGMLAPALDDPDPVLLFEHAALYPMSGELSTTGPVDIDHAAVRRPGADVSLITYGGSLHKVLAAADRLAEQGVDAEVLDLRVLRPLDEAAILTTVAGTHRAVIVDEGWRSGSIAAEISARITEHAFYELDAPVARVCSAEVPIPFAKHLEDAAIPQVDDIVAATRATLGLDPRGS